MNHITREEALLGSIFMHLNAVSDELGSSNLKDQLAFAYEHADQLFHLCIQYRAALTTINGLLGKAKAIPAIQSVLDELQQPI